MVEQRPQQQPHINGLLKNREGQQDHAPPPLHHHTVQAKAERQRTHHHAESPDGIPGGHSGFPLAHKLPGSSEPPASNAGKHAPEPSCPPSPPQQLAGIQHRKKKSKKHKERERLKEEQGREWSESSPDLKRGVDKLDNPDITKAVPSEEKPDYVLKYSTITSSEQRQRYQVDFCAEYDEYRDLHSRISTITHMFVQLGSKIKSLSPGTQEHKIMEDQIMEKYNKYKKKFPSYREEKKRCEYLHEKLSHIKQLIADYDVPRASS